MPPVAAMDRMLDEIASAAVTGQIVVVSSIVSVTTTVDTPSGRSVGIEEPLGQFVMVGAQLRTVWVEVVRTVSVVRLSPALAASEGKSGSPVTLPLMAADTILDEMDPAALTGQTVVESTTVSVTRIVDTCSGDELARLLREAGLAGQFVTAGAQLRIVWVAVARTVRVVSCSPPSEATAVAPPLDWLVGTGGLEGVRPAPELAPESEVDVWLRVTEPVVVVGKNEPEEFL